MELDHFTTSTLVSSTEVELIGFSVKATSDAEVVFHESDDNTGTVVLYLLLGEGQSVTEELGLKLDALYVEVVSGDVEGSVWVS